MDHIKIITEVDVLLSLLTRIKKYTRFWERDD